VLVGAERLPLTISCVWCAEALLDWLTTKIAKDATTITQITSDAIRSNRTIEEITSLD
jgi:hypothetical protein